MIVGNGEHPEVQGIRGWAGEQVTVVQTQEDAERFELPDKDQKYVSWPRRHLTTINSKN